MPRNDGPGLTLPGGTFVRRWGGAALTLLLVALAACSAGAVQSFDPSAACATDARTPGAYPSLEVLLPKEVDGQAPTRVDSGRNCTTQNLGALAGHGIREVRFAGAVWDFGANKSLALALFEAPGLEPAALSEFYETPVRASDKTKAIATTDVTVGVHPGRRFDVLFGDRAETVVTWATDTPGRVRALLASDLGDAKVAELLSSLG